MTEFSNEVLFEKFLDYIELYFKSRENLIQNINRVKLTAENLDEEQLEFHFGDEQQEVDQYRDLAKSALDSYIREFVKRIDG